MNLFHGSTHVVERPVFGAGNPRNDFGRGFYCTESYALAGEWACKANTDGFINCYSLQLKELVTLNLMDGSHTVLEWIALLLANRQFTPHSRLGRNVRDFLLDECFVDTAPYDIIVGYRADDSYFSYAEDFVEGTLSVAELSAALILGDLGLQVVVKSQRAFEALDFRGAENAKASQYFPRFNSRDAKARGAYARGDFCGDSGDWSGALDEARQIYALDLYRKEVAPCDECIPRMLPQER